jgi:hypothetical protein
LDATQEAFDGRSHLVTVHVLTEAQFKKNGGFSKKISGLASSDRGFRPLSQDEKVKAHNDFDSL